MKRRLGVAAVLLGLFALPIAVGAGFVAWQRSAAAAQWPVLEEQRPLPLSEPPLAPDEPAWALLTQATEAVPDGTEVAKEQLRTKGMPTTPGAWQTHEAALELLDQALARPGLSTPARTGIEDEGPDLLGIMGLGRLQLLRAWDQAAVGDRAQAVDSMLVAFDLGTRLTDGSADLLTIMVGTAISELAFEELEELLGTAAQVDVAAHQRALEGLAARQRPGELATVRGMATDCTLLEQTFWELGERPARLLEGPGLDGDTNSPHPVLSRLVSLRYDADATVAWHRLQCRSVMRRMAEPPYAREPWQERELPASSAYNDIGKVLLSVATPDATALADQERRIELWRRGLMVVVALHLHELEHGALPASLDALTPHLLAEVPVDPFTGSPLELEDGTITTGSSFNGEPPLAWVLGE